MKIYSRAMLQKMLRELLLRNQLALPTNDEDLKWWDEGMKTASVKDFYEAAGLFDEEMDKMIKSIHP